jgi:apolipoprotein N-acyltransferase
MTQGSMVNTVWHRIRPLMSGRNAMAVFAGILWACAFPNLGIAGFGWVAPGLMLLAGSGASRREAFVCGYLSGLTHFLVSLSWLLNIPFPAGAITGWFVLCAFLALYPALWVCLCIEWIPCVSDQAFHRESSGLFSKTMQLGGWPRRALWAMQCAAAWTALEFLRGWFLSGFPWNNLSASQFQIIPLIQLAAITGTAGISFLMVWCSCAFASAVILIIETPRRWGRLASELAAPMFVFAIVFSTGISKVMTPAGQGRILRIALVQPSIPQTLIWNPLEATNRFLKLIELSEAAMASKPDLLVWPEAAVPNLLRYDLDLTYPAITNLVRKHNVWLVLGADDAEKSTSAKSREDYDYFNSSFLISPMGELVGQYRKQHLVMFGEYVPFSKTFPFLKGLAPIGDGFKPGDHAVSFAIPPLQIRTAVLICFEDIFPSLARKAVGDDTDFLINLTNNGWFGEGSAQWQHAASAVFRAVENGLPLVRCANNGLTCWVDSFGRLHDVYFDGSKDIYKAGIKVVNLSLPLSGSRRADTFYHIHGEWFALGCSAFTLASLAPLFIRRKPVSGPDIPGISS